MTIRPVPWLRRTLLLAALALPLGSCANPRADEALFAQRAFIGMSKQTLLSCAGVPERSATIDNVEYFTYGSQRIVSYPSSNWGWYGRHGPGWAGWPYYGYDWPATTYDVRSYSCEATFTLRNGKVERVVYGGDDGAGGSRLAQCYNIVENCLTQVPHPTPSPR